MTEEQIERSVEVKMNAADNALMNGRMTQAEYDAHVKELNRWSENQYRSASKNGFAEQDGQNYSKDYHWG